jgi:anaerobic ribonucleoside-triphosphate reductase
MQVKKRDGQIVRFNQSKIMDAISKANKSVEKKERANTNERKEIIKYIKSLKLSEISVEEIQDIIEQKLMELNKFELAKKYILYREERTKIRNRNSQLMKDVAKKINASDVQNQNANVDENSFGGRAGEARDELLKDYALNYIVSDMSKNNHLNNEIYIHDLSSYAIGMHNCVGRETEFLTTDGVKSFYDFSNGDEIEVLTHTGEIKKAKVKKYGQQQLYRITFKKGGNVHKTIRATRNHRWLLQNGEFTTELKVGDKLIDAPEVREFDYNNATTKEKLMWCKGFAYGDGTLEYNLDKKTGEYKKDNRVRIRLCNRKQQYLNRFKIEGCAINRQTTNNEPIIKIYNYDKTIPNFNNYNELKAFVDGIYCADGYKGSHCGIQFTGKEQCNFVEDYFESCGYYITSQRNKTNQITNFGKRKDITVEYSFLGKPNHFKYTVEKIALDEVEDVWCLEVEDNHTFILSGGIVTGNCLSIPFDDLLKNGFNTRQTDVRPAQSINTAFQLLAVIFQLQSLQQFGGVSATHLDWTMVPYVRKSFYKHFMDGVKYIEEMDCFFDLEDKEEISIEDERYKKFPKSYKYAMDKTKKELQQAVEGMYHNLNTLQSRSGNQLPFTSINYGTCTLPEGRMVIKALLEGSIKGVGKVHKTPVFPCGIFQCMKGVNRKEGEPNYDLFKLALKSTAQRLYPNYANVDWSGNEGYDKNDPKTYFSTMGCRTANGFDINANPGVNPQTKDGRGNICPVTIIMPTLAMEANREVEPFIELLDKKIHEAKDMLIERYNYIISQNPESGKFMYENNVMSGFDGKTIESAMKHGTLAIGQLGLAETLRILIDKDQTTEEGMQLAKRIEQLFKDRCSEFKKEYKLNFGVYFTPAENLCYTAMKKFQKKYGKIKDVSDKDFFTNSMHCSVWKELTPFEKIDIESQLTGYSSARLYNICRIRRDCKK